MKRYTMLVRMGALVLAVVTTMSACTGSTSGPSESAKSSSGGSTVLAIRVSCVATGCAHTPSAARLASMANARSCTKWQLNEGSHGGPDYLIKLLTTHADATRVRSTVLSLPGVRTAIEIPTAALNQTPSPDTNFDKPSAIRCG